MAEAIDYMKHTQNDFISCLIDEKVRSKENKPNGHMTSYQRRCDVIASHRRRYDVSLAPYAHEKENKIR